MGQIYAREVTGLSRKNHRLVVRAVKRARAAGLLSTVHRAITRLQQ
jgi:ribosomal protein S18